MLDKSQVRASIKDQITRQSVDYFYQSSKTISSLLDITFRSIAFQANRSLVIGVYAPVWGEVMWGVSMPLKWGAHFAFPRFTLDESKMEFYQTDLADLRQKQCGKIIFFVPPKIDKVIPDLVVVPALGLTKDGARLGRGKGHYDRYLQDFKRPKIGLSYSFQEFTELPVEKHDIKMDLVINEKTILSYSSIERICRDIWR